MTLDKIFGTRKVVLYQNEMLDLDHYYQEPYQDESDEIKDIGQPFETDKSKKKRRIDVSGDNRSSGFSYFMDGSRRTYKIGDMVLSGKKIYPVVVAQVRAGCTVRDASGKLHLHGDLEHKNLLLICNRLNNVDFAEIKYRIEKSDTAKRLDLGVVAYALKSDEKPADCAIAKANSVMHEMEISILQNMVNSDVLDTDKMLIVDGPLQFINEDRSPEFADLFYNVAGVSKSFNPMLPTSDKEKRGGTQIGAELVKLEYGERTPVFLKENSKGRKFGCWYLRIRPKNRVSNTLEGIVKIEKIAIREHESGLDTSIVDTISQSILNEGAPTCYGRDSRWASHLYPVYLTETLVKSSFESDFVFMSNFKRDFK